MKEYLIGINWEQNSTAALFRNGTCLGALSNERITRRKNDEAYPKEAIDWLLSEFRVDPADLEVVFVSTQWAPGWILTRHYTSFTTADYLREQNDLWYPNLYEGKSLSPVEIFRDKLDYEQFPGRQFWIQALGKYENEMAHPSNEKVEHLGQEIRTEVVRQHLGDIDVYFMDHSSCHNAYAYYSQPNRTDRFLSISLDAFGDGTNYSAKLYEPKYERIQTTDIASGGDFIVGRLYRYITLILGLKPNEHEYKVMGLAPYCKSKYYQHLFALFKDIQSVDGLHFVYKTKLRDHFFEIREKLYSERFDSIAGGLQAYTEFLIQSWVENLLAEAKVDSICFAGGVAMNVKANMLISKIKGIKQFHVPVTPDDASQAIGACYQLLHERKLNRKSISPVLSPYLGRSSDVSKSEILDSLSRLSPDRSYKIIHTNHLDEAAKALADGKILGVVWGREEFGARALGNRSIVANPENENIKIKINEAIKDRDFWMPFAASVLEKYASQYLVLDVAPSSYSFMTNTCESTRLGREKLAAAIHPYDKTCRPHVVTAGSNRDYESLIQKFGDITGIYALLNTSLNLHGYPICSTHEDAIHVLSASNLDGLLTRDLLIMKV